MFQRTRFKLVFYAILLLIALGLLLWWRDYSSARGRDFERLGEMKVLQNAMLDYFSRYNTYQIENCQNNSPIASCLNQAGTDPLNTGSYRYLVKNLADDNFAIGFSLEAGVGGLKKGSYVLTKSGIIK